MGFVTSLAGTVQLASDECEELQKILSNCPEWEEFISGDYTDMKNLENKSLGGNNKESSEEEPPQSEPPVITFIF